MAERQGALAQPSGHVHLGKRAMRVADIMKQEILILKTPESIWEAA